MADDKKIVVGAPPPGKLRGDDEADAPSAYFDPLNPNSARQVGAVGAGGATTVVPNQIVGGTQNYYSDPLSFMLGRDPNYTKDQATRMDALGAQGGQYYSDLALQARDDSALGKHALLDQGKAANAAVQQQAGAINQQAQNVGAYGLGQAQQLAGAGQAIQNVGAAQGQAITNAARSQAGSINDYAMQQAALGRSVMNRAALPEGPSAAQAQLQSGFNQAMGQNLSLARSGRGWGQSAGAMSQALNQNAAMGQEAANRSAMLRSQESQAHQQLQMQQRALNDQTALGLGGQALSGMGAAGQLGLSGAQAGGTLGLNAALGGQNLAYQGGQLGMQGQQLQGQMMNDAGQLGLQGQQMGLSATQSGYDMGLKGVGMQGSLYGMGLASQFQGADASQKMWLAQNDIDLARENQFMQEMGIQNGIAIAAQQRRDNREAAYLNAGATFAAAGLSAVSDERAKTDIDSASGDLLDVKSYSYNYVNPLHGEGRFWGPMAQELEKTPAGKSTVETRADGLKTVNTARLALVNTAETANVKAEVRALKRQLARLMKEAS